MPLTRENVTVASRVMLPAYALFFGTVGLSLLLTPQERLRQTPAFKYADRVIDLDVWGLCFLALAGGLFLALALHHRNLYRGMLGAAIVWMLAYATMTAVAAFNGQTTYAAWAWPTFVAVACWASLVSITSREVGPPA